MEVKNIQDLRVLIAEKGMNIKSLSDRTGISQSYLSLIVNGKRTPSPVTAKKISEELKKEVNEIFFINVDNKSI